MAKTNLEIERGGFLYDQFNRKEIAFRELNSAELTSDRPEGGTRKDEDGRELLVAVGLTPMLGVVNAKDPKYGAKGDGVTDDTEAIKAAAKAAGNGGSCFLPEGEYLISGEISLPYEHFTLRGAGYHSTRLKLKNSTNTPMFSTPDDAVQRKGLLMKDFAIDGNAANQTGTSPTIKVRGMNETRLEGLYVINPRGPAIFFGQATGGIFNTVPMITRCVLRGENSQEHGIALESGSSDAQVIGCDIGEFTKGAGILCSGHAGYELIGNQCWQCKNGYNIFTGSRGRLVGNLSDLSKQHGYVLQNVNDTQLIGCQARESGQTKSSEFDGFLLEHTEAGKKCENTMFVGCRAMGLPTRHGLNIRQRALNTGVIGCDFQETVEGGFAEGAEVEHSMIVASAREASKFDKGIGLFGKTAPAAQPAEIVPAAITVKELMEKLNTLHKEYGITA